ncbi:MAG: calcineurin-like phosphoesterase C-terminal domain-containing protein, partial [Muribaculaceae bacterium]|nr:calcineurin-like phosphoesterase C-terminal domain-containing protein [Muribaculaceae bacterium]
IFHCMGNHDNDIKVKGDWNCAQAWRSHVGPTYYSVNLGKVHYVILDDIEYLNTTGDREQNNRIMPEQMAWLKKDLAMVSDKSAPLVVCMHVPLHKRADIDASGRQIDDPSYLDNASELIAAVSEFTNVKLLTGHTHINYDARNGSNIHEYNIAGVCATWWWTGAPNYHNNHICREGSPGGYGVFEWNGTTYNHYYKGIGHDRSYQIRTYDLNNVLISREVHCPKANAEMAALIPTYAMGYDKVNNNNEVLVNVFNFGYDWKIEVSENGKSLAVTRINGYDPLHIISFEMARLDQNKHNFSGSSMRSCWSTHLFKVKASSATSTLDITVTDEHGNVYTETMTRPKNFTYTMK